MDIKILDFYTDWCVPCKMIEPILEEISNQMGITIQKINSEKEEELAQEYGIYSVPTLVVLKGDAEVGRINGALPRERLIQKIEEVANQ